MKNIGAGKDGDDKSNQASDVKRMGLSSVNSSIGAQWERKYGELKTHVDSFIGARKQIPAEELNAKLQEKMNVKLDPNG